MYYAKKQAEEQARNHYQQGSSYYPQSQTVDEAPPAYIHFASNTNP
jgi:hypothetical protein